MNAEIVGERDDVRSVKINYCSSHNIGITMDTPYGLRIPNIKNVQDKAILEIVVELHRLVELGKTNDLSLEDMLDSTITLTNFGSVGGKYGRTVVLDSEIAIVGLGKARKLPRFDDQDNIVPKHLMPISWDADHRLIDGATLARITNY